MSFTINIETKQKGAYIVTVKGDMDHEGSQTFEKHTEALIGFKPKHVLIDMSEVGYISSAGIGTLFHLTKRIREEGGVVSLFGLQHQVRSVIDAVKTVPLENIFETREECDTFLRELQDLGKKFKPADPLHQDPLD